MFLPYLGLFTMGPNYFPLENILVPCARVCLESLKDNMGVRVQTGILSAARFPLSFTVCSLAKETGRSIYCSRHLPFPIQSAVFPHNPVTFGRPGPKGNVALLHCSVSRAVGRCAHGILPAVFSRKRCVWW